LLYDGVWEHKMNKRGVMMALYMAVITIFMCVVAVLLFLHQNNKIQNSMVSPIPVLKIEDQRNIFESWESTTLYSIAGDFKKNGWGDADSFKQKLCTGFNADYGLFKDFFNLESNSNFCNSIYQVRFDGDILNIERAPTSRSQRLAASNTQVPNFQVVFEYSFPGKYLINKNNLK
jgi:hypothetical protein